MEISGESEFKEIVCSTALFSRWNTKFVLRTQHVLASCAAESNAVRSNKSVKAIFLFIK